MKDLLLEDFFNELFRRFEINMNSFISSDEVKKNRPIVEVSAAYLVRDGRDSRWFQNFYFKASAISLRR